MNGFGKDLTSETKSTQLFRKVDFNNFQNEGELCFSTENSVELSSHGEFCLVLEKAEYNGVYANGDADAGKNFGYDEFRVKMTEEELFAKVDFIIVPNHWWDAMEDENYEAKEGQDPYEWIETLQSFGRVIAERDCNYKILFNLN